MTQKRTRRRKSERPKETNNYGAILDKILWQVSGRRYFSGNQAYRICVEDVIKELWLDGTLPHYAYGQWLVGASVYTSGYLSFSVTGLCAGPKKPSKYKPHYARIHSQPHPLWGYVR